MIVSSEEGTVKNWRDWGMCYSSSLFCFPKYFLIILDEPKMYMLLTSLQRHVKQIFLLFIFKKAQRVKINSDKGAAYKVYSTLFRLISSTNFVHSVVLT